MTIDHVVLTCSPPRAADAFEDSRALNHFGSLFTRSLSGLSCACHPWLTGTRVAVHVCYTYNSESRGSQMFCASQSRGYHMFTTPSSGHLRSTLEHAAFICSGHLDHVILSSAPRAAISSEVRKITGCSVVPCAPESRRLQIFTSTFEV